jgi:diamine N-acetyltransferase
MPDPGEDGPAEHDAEGGARNGATDADGAARNGATDAIAAWADGRIAAGEAAVPREPRPAPDATVDLREVTGETVRAVCLLHVAPDQRHLVAPNAVSFAEALFEPKAWYRAVVADDVPVGFVMLSIDEAAPEYYLWRFMIDQRYQGRGYGRAAILQLIEHVRTLPDATELLVSWVPEAGGPEPFYRGLGFEPTGEVDEGEVVARYRL